MKRKKRNNTKLGWFLIILGIIMFITFWFATQQVIFQPSNQIFSQYTGRPVEGDGGWKPGFPDNKVYSNDVTFNLNEDILKFSSEVGGWGSCGTNPDNTIIGTCCQTINVYKNDVLIDTLRTGFAGTSSSSNTLGTSFTFNNNGRCNSSCNSNNSFSVVISPQFFANYYANNCRSIGNSYQLSFPTNSFDLSISNLNESYQTGDQVDINIKLVNNVGNTKGKLKIKYDITTIIGNFQKTVIEDINISSGVNYINFTLPSDAIVSNLLITPEIELYYPSSYMTGLFDLTSDPYLNIGSFTGNTSKITIRNDSIIIIQDNKTKANYYRYIVNQCIQLSLYDEQVNITTDFTALDSCQALITYNCSYYNNCSAIIYNCSYYNNCTTNVNLTTCYKIRSFIKQSAYNTEEDTPCYSYQKQTSCNDNEYTTLEECINTYEKTPWYIQLWNKYGFILSIITGFISLCFYIYYIIKNRRKKK